MKYYKKLGDNSYYTFKGIIYPENYKKGYMNPVSVLVNYYPSEWQEVPAGDYFVQENRLPECFRVKMIKHPLREKYIEWWKNEFNSEFYYEGDLDKFYGFDGYDRTDVSNTAIDNNIPENAIELTLEQWDKIINKKETDMKKEIIGYRLKEDCKKYSKAAFEICTGYMNEKGLIGDIINDGDIEKLKEAGVLDLWFEPIYKAEIPDIKAGDYIYIIDACGANREYFSKYNGDILKVTSFKKEKLRQLGLKDSYWLRHTPGSFSDGGFRVHESAWEYGVHFRKATKEEILKYLQVEFTKTTDIDVDSKVTINAVENGYYDSRLKEWNESNHFYGNRKVISFELIYDRLVVKVSNTTSNIYIAVEALQKANLTFGGCNVTFEKIISGVKITCNGETGTLSQMQKIYDFITEFPTFKFGSQRLERIDFPDVNVHFDDLQVLPDSIKIGCIIGTWKEFCNILEEAKNSTNARDLY